MSLVETEILNELAHLASHLDSKLTIEIDTNKLATEFPVKISVGRFSYEAMEVNNAVLLATLSKLAMHVKGVLDEEDIKDQNEEASPQAT
jgi:hypothetical protein